MVVVKASEIAAAAYEKKSLAENDDHSLLNFDLGNLVAVDAQSFQYVSEQKLHQFNRTKVQLLMNEVFNLPTQPSDLGPLALLPTPTTVIPREKPLPAPKAPTRWETFAKEKGIKKTKRSRMLFDEQKEEWAPRHGYQRANDDLSDWAIEVKANSDPSIDPWTQRKQAKKERVDKNLRQQANNKNMGRGNGKLSSLPSGIPVELTKTDDVKAKQRGKEGTSKTLEKAQFSTASMGKFDKYRNGEKERVVKGKRNTFLPVVGSEKLEKERAVTVLNSVLGKSENKRKSVGHDDDDTDNTEGKRKKRGKKLKNITKGKAKKMRSK